MKDQKNFWIITRVLIFLNAVAFVEFGVRFLFWTEYYAERDGIRFENVGAQADFRAFFGGLVLSIGVFFLWSLFKKEWVRPSLLVVALTSLFLLGARVYSFALVGSFIESMLVPTVIETISGVLAVVLLRKAPN